MKRGRKAGHTSTAESFAILNGKPGDWLYTEKADKDITAIASYHKRLVTTERCLIVHHNLVPPQTLTITKVVLFGWREEKVEDEKIPAGYRMLEEGENVKVGDEVLIDGNWYPALSSIGITVDAWDDGNAYRRPITEPTEQVGEYRYLEAGEIIEEGDELLAYPDTNIWNKALFSIGNKMTSEREKYRLPIPAEPRYRPFGKGDVIEEGDQGSISGEYFDFPHTTIGKTIHPDNVPFSRKLIK